MPPKKTNKEIINWIFEGKQIQEIDDFPKQFQKYEGFVYLISFLNGDYYIGQKQIRLSNKRKIGKKELETYPDKRRLNRRKVKTGKSKGEWVYYEEIYKEDWQEYISSSDIVKERIKYGEDYKKEIILFVKKVGLLNFFETKQIMCSNCMEDEKCLNDHVGNYYKRNILNKNC